MSDADPDSTSPTPRRHVVAWTLLAVAVVVVVLLAWRAWPDDAADAITDETVDLSPEALDARLLQAESAITSVRRLQDSTNQRLADTSARTGLLRDEVLGVVAARGLDRRQRARPVEHAQRRHRRPAHGRSGAAADHGRRAPAPGR